MAHQGQHLDKNGDASIVMEAMVSPDLRFWHAAVGFPGSNNDITILDKSSFLLDVLSSYNVGLEFVINGHNYHHVSFATDGIYPCLRVFFKPYTNPQGSERSLYTEIVESVRKEIERGSFFFLPPTRHLVPCVSCALSVLLVTFLLVAPCPFP